MTIEHLLPQSKIEQYGDNVIGQLGNLILVTPELQLELAEKDLAQKIEILKENNYPLGLFKELPTVINNENEMNIIAKRTKKMAEYAFNKVWNI